jgi:hypothetical protein
MRSTLVGLLVALSAMSPSGTRALPAGEACNGEDACIRMYPGHVSRSGDALRIRLDNGRITTLKSTPKVCAGGNYDGCMIQTLVAYRPVEGLYVVDVGFLEGGRTEVFARADGRSVSVNNTAPEFSLSGRLFVAVESSEAYDMQDRDLSIWSTGKGVPALVWSHKPGDGYEIFEFVAWEGEDRVKLRATFGTDEKGTLKEGTAAVVRGPGGWKLEYAR